MISVGTKVQTNKFYIPLFNCRINYERSCQKGATGVDVDIMILIKFNDTK